MKSQGSSVGVAIVGIACRFPGASDHHAYWRNLCRGIESIAVLSDADLAAAGVPTERSSDPSYVKAASILDDIDQFDAHFFEYSPAEARLMDPQHRLLLEVSWAAFEDAGYRVGGASLPAGVFVGAGGIVSSYLIDRMASSAELPGYTGSIAHIGNDKDFLSTRISYKLNLTGPSVNVQTACSTSLVAVHFACQAILAGECEMALAGAASVRVPQRVGYLSRQGDILSPDGHCRAFDEAAHGTIFGSGVGALVLKELQQAIADRDNIYAVIRGSAINNDGGEKVSYTASSVEAQSRAMIEAISVANVSPNDIGYVECHGTGTIVGDPLEVAALTRAFRSGTKRCGFCAIGSVKTNIGHLEQTAGMAGLIKAALATKEGKIPASLNFRKANRNIDFANSPFFVNTECREWTEHHARVAGVNSLGIGGTNAFLIVEEAPRSDATQHVAPPLELFTLSAKTATALQASTAQHLTALQDQSETQLPDICFTRNSGRSHFSHRIAVVTRSVSQLRSTLANDQHRDVVDRHPTPDNSARRIAFLYSGQGSQRAGMGAELYRYQPVYRDVIDRCDDFLREQLEFPLLKVLFDNNISPIHIHQTGHAQPALFAVQAALTTLWRSWGIIPHAVLGHSVGEFACAYSAGVYSLENALSLVTERARLMQSLRAGGAMASILADESTVNPVIQRKAKKLAIAAVNAPRNTVISGEREAVNAVVEHFETAGIRAQFLKVSHAFHSPLMQPMVTEFGRVADTTPGKLPNITWISTLTGTAVTKAASAEYWCEHALNPVRFAEAMEQIVQSGATDFVEIGPGTTMLTLGQQCVSGDRSLWLGSLADSRHGDLERILLSLGELYHRGYDIDWDGFHRPYPRRRISLPTYPFEHQHYWLDSGVDARQQNATVDPPSLTGSRLRSALPDIQFETVYSLSRFGYLNDHRIHGMPVLPLTVGLVALTEVARQHFKAASVAMANLQYREAMVLPDIGDRIVQIILTPRDDATAEFRVASLAPESAAEWRTHMVGMVQKEVPPNVTTPLALDRNRLQRQAAAVSTERHYATLNTVGLQYGPSFRGIKELWRADGEALTHVVLPAHVVGQNTSSLHPALLDACLHVYPALLEADGDVQGASAKRRTHMPIGLERFSSITSDAREVWVHAIRRHDQKDLDTVTIDIAIFREDGSPIAALEGLAVKQLPPEALIPTPTAGKVDWLYHSEWLERPPLQRPVARLGKHSGWLILADRGGVGAALGKFLTDKGATCRLVYADRFNKRQKNLARNSDDFVKSFEKLICKFGERSDSLRGIINLWPLDFSSRGLTLAKLNEAQKIVVGATVSLLRAAVQVCGQANIPPRIWLITRNVIPIPSERSPTEIATAAVWGLGRSISLEHPRFWGGLVDIAARPDISPSAEAEGLLREILNSDGEDQIALRGNIRFAARLVRATALRQTPAACDSNACYLITGGLGALGFEVAKWLVTQRQVRHLILVGRRGREDPNAKPFQQALAALGAEVIVLEADVTKEQDVRRLVDHIEKFRPLKGIFHCAGMLDDGILMQMDWQKFERVLAPKLAGGWLLDQLTRKFKLDHFVMFSSILSLTGSAGQANYSAANSFLDALVDRRRKEGLPGLALSWGPWEGSGLATASGEKGRTIWRARGTEYISADVGWQALDLLVGSDAAHAAITITNWSTFLQQFTSTPPLYSELSKQTVAQSTTGTSTGTALRDKLKETSPVERHDLLTTFVRRQAMQTLGTSEEINANRPLREFGLDSLMSVTLANRLEAALGIRLSAVKLIQGPSIEQIVSDISTDLGYPKQNLVETLPRRRSKRVSDRWLITSNPRPAPRLRLFCFPFAGGGSAVYHDWPQSLDPAIEVVAIEPPGRLGRIKEKPISDIRKFTTELILEMRTLLDRPFAFFGHCLGGLTMYETSRRLIHSTKFRPIHLFVSGARPPDRILDQGRFEERLLDDLLNLAAFKLNLPAHVQPDDVFGEIIRHFNIRATDEMLRDPKLRKLMFPVVRAEFKMASNYKFVAERPWDIPITCFAARGDPYVSRRHALGWGRFTNSRLQVYIRKGAHFAVVEDASFIHSIINRELRTLLQD